MSFKNQLTYRFGLWKRSAFHSGPVAMKEELEVAKAGILQASDGAASLALIVAAYLIVLPVLLIAMPAIAWFCANGEPPCKEDK